ncbi:unnamed protein product [Ectocarpus sp. 12 AP-2014]
MAVMKSEDWGSSDAMSDGEMTTVSAICNRVSRMLGLLDREGLQRDISIVQATCPLDLEALLSSRDKVFVDELLTIVDSTDRTTGSLKGGYRSRFALDDLPGRFI